MDDYAGEMQEVEFAYALGSVVWINSQAWAKEPWKAQIVNQFYDEDGDVAMYWYEVVPLEGDPPATYYHKSPYIVSESEISGHDW